MEFGRIEYAPGDDRCRVVEAPLVRARAARCECQRMCCLVAQMCRELRLRELVEQPRCDDERGGAGRANDELAKHSRRGDVQCARSVSALAAQMKSFIDRPPTSCVENRTLQRPQPSSRSG